MVNVVVLMGILLDGDSKEPSIRYLEIIEDFKSEDGKLKRDIVPLISWTKENKGDLFSLLSNSLVMIKGRIELINNKMLIVCENITYLGKNDF